MAPQYLEESRTQKILLLSVVGAETGVKALTAGLRSSAGDQQRIEYTVHLGPVNRTGLHRCPDGYRVYRTTADSLTRLDHGPAVVVSLENTPAAAAGSAVWLDDAAIGSGRSHVQGAIVVVQPRSARLPG